MKEEQDISSAVRGETPTVIHIHRGPPQAVWWLMALAVMAMATAMVLRLDGPSASTSAFAQGVAGARGVFAFSGQLSANSYGVFMVDVDAATIWCYEYMQDSKKLRLVAGRGWVYDRYLEAFNTEDPSLNLVKELVEKQREMKQNAAENAGG